MVKKSKNKETPKTALKKKEFQETRITLIHRYTFAILGLILLLHVLVYFAFYLRESRELENQAIERSRLFATELVNAVTGNSSGDLAKRTEKLQNLMSLMRISKFARDEGQMQFHFAAAEPVNAENSPDPFEKKAIDLFQDGKLHEYFSFFYGSEYPRIQYSKPIFSQTGCKSCHEENRFKDGELRGVVSIRLPIKNSLQRFAEKKRFYIWSCVTLVLAVSLVVLSLARQLGSQIKNSYRIEQESSQTDPLTGLPTRTFILDRLRQEANRAARHDTPLSAILVSIDHLGAVNNRYGQKAGDAVLLELSSQAIKDLRDYDMVGRYGGEEYLVVLPFTKLEAAREVAERLRSDIENLVVNFKGRFIKVTVSAGVAQWRGESENIDQLLHRLGMAQYNAQANGRNRVEIDDMMMV